MILKPLSLDDMQQTRRWRNGCLETMRTPYMLTEQMQKDYYYDTICNRKSNTRYWGLWEDINKGEYLEKHPGIHFSMDFMETKINDLVGYGGIENIEWENSRGEISLLIAPDYRKNGKGSEAVHLILDQAFNYLNLQRVYGECYLSSTAVYFWKKIVAKYKAYWTPLPDIKYYKGEYWDSYYFMFRKEQFNESMHNTSTQGQ